MTKKIFRSILAVAGTVLLASLLVIMGCLYEYFGSVEKKQLRDELELAAVAVKENGTEYLSQLSSERYRLTWIENDGTVLYDTVTDAESLENHADRVEVKQALEYGVKVFGVTIHYVDAELDGGRIIAQRAFPYEGDDIGELEAMIHAVEYPLYIETIKKLIE